MGNSSILWNKVESKPAMIAAESRVPLGNHAVLGVPIKAGIEGRKPKDTRIGRVARLAPVYHAGAFEFCFTPALDYSVLSI